MNRAPGRLLVGSLSILFLVSLVLLGLQAARIGRLEDREDTWGDYKVRLDARVEAAEKQSLFFLEKLAELRRPASEPGRNGSERSEEETRRWQTLSSKLEEVVQRIDELEERLAQAEKSDDEEAAALRELVKKQLEELSASTDAATSEISSLRDQMAVVSAARERVDARLSELARKIERENGPSSPIDELQTLEDLVNGMSEKLETKLEKQQEELSLLRKRADEAALSREEIVSSVEEIRGELARSPSEEPGKGPALVGTEGGTGTDQPTGGDGPTTPAAEPEEVSPAETTPTTKDPAEDLVSRIGKLPVIFVDGAKGRVVLGGGKDAGIRSGQIFDIHRDGRRIGQIRIYGTGGGMAAGAIINLTSGESVKKGDTGRLVASPSAPSGGETPRLEIRDVPPPPGTDEGS